MAITTTESMSKPKLARCYLCGKPSGLLVVRPNGERVCGSCAGFEGQEYQGKTCPTCNGLGEVPDEGEEG